MPWNDSGRNENPWQRKPDQQPPDLDQVVRDLQRRLRSLFGGGGSGPRPAGGAGGGRWSLNAGYLVVAALAVWAMTGFYQNDAAERSVITRFGKYVGTTQPGLHWHLPWPIEQRLMVNVSEFLSFEDRTRMLTQDEALVGINLAVQYRRADPVQFAFNVRDPEDTLKEVSESAIREVIGQSKLDFVLEKGRQEISARTKELIQRTITSYNTGIEIISVNLQDVIVPEQVAPAQKDAIKAREDRDRANLAAQTYANDILPKARGLAASQLEAARAHRERVVAEADGQSTRFAALAVEYQRAPEVTRRRLYLETMEQVLASSAKVIVDTKGTGNMIYLPLDRLLEQRNQPRNGTVTIEPSASMPMEAAPDAAAQPDLRSRGNR
ncbi:MAG: rane protease subunit HflK [Proteobacteria bacterium]|nr:rane protease subunit HflK [Pseudomonadota bacterium]